MGKKRKKQFQGTDAAFHAATGATANVAEHLATVYGADALPAFEFNNAQAAESSLEIVEPELYGVKGRAKRPHNLKDIQNLILWMLADGSKPEFIFVKNKPLISKVVVLATQGITEPILKRFGATYCPFLMSLARFVTKAPGQLSRIELPLTPLLERPLKNKKAQQQQHQQATLTPAVSLAIAASMSTASTADATTSTVATSISASATISTTSSSTATTQSLQSLALEQILTREQLITNAFPLQLTDDEATQYATIASACACVSYLHTSSSTSTQKARSIVTIDCEMVRCDDNALALAWLVAIDEKDNVLLDTFVQPSLPVTDYLTQFSGVDKAILANVTTTLQDAQQQLLQFVNADTILCGHSLENDLHALKMVHERIIDTSVLYPRTSPPSRFTKHSLRYLTKEFLDKVIQAGASHSPVEDARAAFHLVVKRLHHSDFDTKGSAVGNSGLVDGSSESLFAALQRSGITSSIIDRPGFIGRYLVGSNADALPCNDDATVLAKLLHEVRGSKKFIWAQLNQLAQFYESRSTAIMTKLSPAQSPFAQLKPSTNVDRNDDDNDTQKLELPSVPMSLDDVAQIGNKNSPANESHRTLTTVGACESAGAILAEIDRSARATYDALPPGAVLLLPSLQGDAALVKKWHARRAALQKTPRWTTAHDTALGNLCALERDNVCTFLAVRQRDQPTSTSMTTHTAADSAANAPIDSDVNEQATADETANNDDDIAAVVEENNNDDDEDDNDYEDEDVGEQENDEQQSTTVTSSLSENTKTTTKKKKKNKQNRRNKRRKLKQQ